MWNNGSYSHINVPLFSAGDTLVIFDYFGKRITYYSKDGDWLGSSQVQFEWRQSQLFRIIKDDVTGRFYIHRYSNRARQTLEELNVHTGTVIGSHKTVIERPFAEQVKVHADAVYFLWQDASAGTTRQLYVQRIDEAMAYGLSGQ